MTSDGRLDDGEVRKRIHQMGHVDPSTEEAASDHQRLFNRLELCRLYEKKMPEDGNCQFRSLSDQLHGNPERHKEVRQQVADQLESHAELYGPHVVTPYCDYYDYLVKISQLGEWGDHVTLQAAADLYGVTICVVTSNRESCYFEILPCKKKSNRVIFLTCLDGVHYNSIYSKGDLEQAYKGEPSKSNLKWWKRKK